VNDTTTTVISEESSTTTDPGITTTVVDPVLPSTGAASSNTAWLATLIVGLGLFIVLAVRRPKKTT